VESYDIHSINGGVGGGGGDRRAIVRTTSPSLHHASDDRSEVGEVGYENGREGPILKKRERE